MSRRNEVPAYRLHRQSGQAVVTLSDGFGRRKDVLLGRYRSKESRLEYARIITEWESAGRRLPATGDKPKDLTINELAWSYWQFAQTYYIKDGKPTGEQDAIRLALRFLKAHYSHTLAKDFGPLALKAVRQAMIDHKVTREYKARNPETGQLETRTKIIGNGLCRTTINKTVDRIKRLFSWAVENELVPSSVAHALAEVAGLKKGRSAAREGRKIHPVADDAVNTVLPFLPPMVADMVRVQRLAGCRPQELCIIRPRDLDMTGSVWEYRPSRHKTEHLDRERIIFLGPHAQAILKKYLPLSTEGFFFSPNKSEEARNRHRVEDATNHKPNWQRKARRKRAWGESYDTASYRRAIRRACEHAGIPIWAPNQLRHTAGTMIRKQYGLEASQAVLGHAELGVTQVYAEADLETARRVMAEVG